VEERALDEHLTEEPLRTRYTLEPLAWHWPGRLVVNRGRKCLCSTCNASRRRRSAWPEPVGIWALKAPAEARL